MSPERFTSLLESARQGNEAAWQELYNGLAPVVLGYLRANGAPDAEDVLSEVFLQVARDIATFEGEEGGNPLSGNGALEGEMNEVTLFESALRVAVPTRPDPGLGRDLVPRLAQVARASTLEAEARVSRGRPRSRFALVARVGIAVA